MAFQYGLVRPFNISFFGLWRTVTWIRRITFNEALLSSSVVSPWPDASDLVASTVIV